MGKKKETATSRKRPSTGEDAATDSSPGAGDREQCTSNLNQAEALRLARQVALDRAPGVMKELADKAGGNYLAVRFLLEFAGLVGQPDSAPKQESPALRELLEEMKRIEDSDEVEQTSAAKMNLYNSCDHKSSNCSQESD